MRVFETIMEPRVHTTTIKCDKCGKARGSEFNGFEGFHCFSDLGGYASPFGDMQHWELDLCEECFYELVKGYIRYPESE
jgi:hypothetical protein